MRSKTILARRATAPSASGRALDRHDANPWYRARVIQTFKDGSMEIEWADTRTRTFVMPSETRPIR